jgi:hypothetical protein
VAESFRKATTIAKASDRAKASTIGGGRSEPWQKPGGGSQRTPSGKPSTGKTGPRENTAADFR